jgi:hypothetical protein
MRRPQVTCFCDVDLVHASHPVTGLIELAEAGEIELQFAHRDRSVRGFRGAWTLWLRIKSDESDAPVAIDLHDKADYISDPSLNECRFYYKVNLGDRTFARVPPDRHGKLRPYGPYHPCRPRCDRGLLRRWAGSLSVKIRNRLFHTTAPMSLYAKLHDTASQLRRHRRYLSRRVWNDYEAGPQRAVDYVDNFPILFNPTCWDEAEGDEIREMNEFRARLILALRREFGVRFVGGFRNSGPAASRYPEAVETRPISHDEYIRLLHAAPIVIYGNGKFGCFSWRLAEAFAASQCIVSETISNRADVPLDEQAGCLQCDGVEEMLTTLNRLLDDPDAVAEYSRRTRAFYVDFVRPQARMRRLIDDVLRRTSLAQNFVTAACT